MWGRIGFRKFCCYGFFCVAAFGAYDLNAVASAADKPKSWLLRDQFMGGWGGGRAALAAVSYTHLTLPTKRIV